jgi:hypothetical protein
MAKVPEQELSLFTDPAPKPGIPSGLDPDFARDIPRPPISHVTEQAAQSADISELHRLNSYKGLLGIFGSMNMGENFRRVGRENPGMVATVFAGRFDNAQDALKASAETAEDRKVLEARGHISSMLGLKAMQQSGVVTFTEAKAIAGATYDYYADQFAGLDSKKMTARKKEAAKVNRRIKKLQKID